MLENFENIKAELIEVLPRLQRYARNLSFSETDADELVQSTCLRVLEKHQQYKSGTNFDRWAFTVMRSIQSNYLRSVKKLESLADTEHALQGSDDSETATYHKQVLSMVQGLNISQRQVMLLVYVEGFSYQETADILDVPIGTVMSRIARARIKLAKELA